MRRRRRSWDEDTSTTTPASSSSSSRFIKFQRTLPCCTMTGCHFTYDQEPEYQVHLKKMHRYPCGLCSCRLSTSFLLELHLEESHSPFFWAQYHRGHAVLACFQNCSWKGMKEAQRLQHMLQTHHWQETDYSNILQQVQHGAQRWKQG